jgi:iron-sulfur cluster assembly protein
MVALTPTAAEAVEAIVSQSELPDTAGLRIATQPVSENSSGPQAELRLDLVTEPEPEDAVVEGTPLYVEPATAELLENMVIDADLKENQIQFSIRQQPEGSGEQPEPEA